MANTGRILQSREKRLKSDGVENHCFSPQIPDNVRNQMVLSEIKKAAVKYQNMEIKEQAPCE